MADQDQTENATYSARPGAGRGTPSRRDQPPRLKGSRGTLVTKPKTTKPTTSRPSRIKRRRRR